MADTLTLPNPLSNHLSTAARAISDLFSPAALAIPCLALGVATSEVPGTFWYALLYFVVAVPLPVGYILWMIKTGRATDFHLPNRSDRTLPFVVAIVSALVAAGLLYAFGAPSKFMIPVVTALIQTAALFLITLAWQISIHTATTAGLVTYAVLVLGGAALAFVLLVPLVMWARLYLERHTVSQTIAGALLGSAIFCTMFALHGVVW